MKNPSMAKMANMAGNNRAAMKMKMESAAKMKKAAPMKKDSRSLLDKAKDEAKQLLQGAKAAGRVLVDKDYFRPKKAVEDAVKAYKKEEDKQAAKRKGPMAMKKSAMKMKKGEPMKLKERENPNSSRGKGALKPLDRKVPKKVDSKKDLKPRKPGKSATKFNAKLKAASKAGKLSGKFKEAVDASPAKMKKPMKMKKAAMKMGHKKK